jgi:heme/copper-type cytochrome/quinol oxidase subunit 4
MLLSISIFLLLYGYYSIISKIIKKKSSFGVSMNANILSIIASLMTIYLAIADEILILGIISLFGSTMALSLNIYYKMQNKEKVYDESIKGLFTSGIFSILMIYGIAQAMRSYNVEGKTDNVSARAYSIFFLYMSLNIYYAINPLIILAAGITLCVYLYILYRVYFEKNTMSLDRFKSRV